MTAPRKVCVVTGSRAEYGLLYWTMKALAQNSSFKLQVLVTGMHLSPEFGLTYKQIIQDGFQIDKKVEILLSSDTVVGISKSMGLGMISMAEAFGDIQPDLILVLGDRFEIFCAVAAAMVARIPVAHCHGGETSEGVIDESIRHSITKMSHIHFTATEEYRKRVIQLGENPSHVFNVGALGIENINRLQLLDRPSLEESIGFKLGVKNLMVTFHPVTLDKASAGAQFEQLLKSLSALNDTHIIFTKANADTDGRVINQLIDEYVRHHSSTAVAFTSMGQLRYLSALKYVDGVVGNSSSGLIEVPSFRKVTVNIGDRQQGRIKAESVIDCEPTYEAIKDAIASIYSPGLQQRISGIENPYGTGNASDKIIEVLATTEYDGLLKKKFYDISH